MLLVFDCGAAKVFGIVEKEASPSLPPLREPRQAQLSLRILVDLRRRVGEGPREGGQPFSSCREQLSSVSQQLLISQLSQECQRWQQVKPREGRRCPAAEQEKVVQVKVEQVQVKVSSSAERFRPLGE